MTEDVPGYCGEGDTLSLSKYLKSDVEVVQKTITADGPVLVVESSGGSQYRLRAVDDDDSRLLMEKTDDDGWSPFIRLTATPTNRGVARIITGP